MTELITGKTTQGNYRVVATADMKNLHAFDSLKSFFAQATPQLFKKEKK